MLKEIKHEIWEDKMQEITGKVKDLKNDHTEIKPTRYYNCRDKYTSVDLTRRRLDTREKSKWKTHLRELCKTQRVQKQTKWQ